MAKSSATSRRTFFGAAGAGAAGILASAAGMSSAGAATPSAGIGGVILTTEDANKGLFTVNVGERSLSITDLEFASKIAKAIA